VFPVGGLGTRFLPATKVMPKEMLVVVDKPLIQYAVEEAAAAGVRDFIFVNSRGKSMIDDHFDEHPELISALEAYRSGTRQHSTMQAQAATLSDQDIEDVTAYFVSIGEEDS